MLLDPRYQLEVIGNFCCIRIVVDVRKALRRGIFVSTSHSDKTWLAFKYEKLPVFCFGCGCMAHNVKDCEVISWKDKEKW